MRLNGVSRYLIAKMTGNSGMPEWTRRVTSRIMILIKTGRSNSTSKIAVLVISLLGINTKSLEMLIKSRMVTPIKFGAPLKILPLGDNKISQSHMARSGNCKEEL